jgi:hypothetical protein
LVKKYFHITDIAVVLVEKDGIQWVYMISEATTPEYKALTGHNRMPRLNGEKE